MASREKFDYSAQYFRKTRDGRTFFFPSGVFGKGLLVKTDEGEKRLRQFIRKHQSFSPAIFGSFGVFSVITVLQLAGSHSLQPLIFGALTIIMIFIGVYSLWKKQCVLNKFSPDLELTSVRFPLCAYYRNMARNESWSWLIFSFSAWTIAVSALLIFITDAFSGSWILYGFGIFAIFPTFMLWLMFLKRRLENEETEQAEV